MGTISYLMERLSRTSKTERPAIVVTAFGFTVGPAFVAWQAVSEIQGYKNDLLTTDEAFLEFSCNGHGVQVSEEQSGFEQLEQAMIAVFPSTANWREQVLLPAFEQCRSMLYRRT
ncbi:hypothetical protein MNR01_13830 [Lysobacter sp. S4-A87]|uniref:hypothetical protein n=1 Tax=Lysobacter sp. S4-A87 TaxID=2925843 RepID=UPI001F52F824|nr:hypothetical protein [Lysobacter sp. S4-A87]UNK48810.1 hypothetical protein MNR01_13830 [Lysobacter sp. S4-A87]